MTLDLRPDAVGSIFSHPTLGLAFHLKSLACTKEASTQQEGQAIEREGQAIERAEVDHVKCLAELLFQLVLRRGHPVAYCSKRKKYLAKAQDDDGVSTYSLRQLSSAVISRALPVLREYLAHLVVSSGAMQSKAVATSLLGYMDAQVYLGRNESRKSTTASIQQMLDGLAANDSSSFPHQQAAQLVDPPRIIPYHQILSMDPAVVSTMTAATDPWHILRMRLCRLPGTGRQAFLDQTALRTALGDLIRDSPNVHGKSKLAAFRNALLPEQQQHVSQRASKYIHHPPAFLLGKRKKTD